MGIGGGRTRVRVLVCVCSVLLCGPGQAGRVDRSRVTWPRGDLLSGPNVLSKNIVQIQCAPPEHIDSFDTVQTYSVQEFARVQDSNKVYSTVPSVHANSEVQTLNCARMAQSGMSAAALHLYSTMCHHFVPSLSNNPRPSVHASCTVRHVCVCLVSPHDVFPVSKRCC